MANLREIKKDIDYMISEVMYDCYLALFLHEGKRDAIMDVMQEAAELRNNLFEMVNNPAEKHNKSLVRKHYAFIRNEMTDKVDGLFDKLSAAVK